MARLYIRCDDLGTIPKKITVVIRFKSYNITTKIEAQIMEPIEIWVSQEDQEKAERALEGSPELHRSLGRQLTMGDMMTNSGEIENPNHNQPLSSTEVVKIGAGDDKNEGQKKIHMCQGPSEATFDWCTTRLGGGIEGFTQQFQSWNFGIRSKGVT